VNDDLLLLPTCEVDGHEWLALEDAYGVPAFECERCGMVIGGVDE